MQNDHDYNSNNTDDENPTISGRLHCTKDEVFQ